MKPIRETEAAFSPPICLLDLHWKWSNVLIWLFSYWIYHGIWSHGFKALITSPILSNLILFFIIIVNWISLVCLVLKKNNSTRLETSDIKRTFLRWSRERRITVQDKAQPQQSACSDSHVFHVLDWYSFFWKLQNSLLGSNEVYCWIV